MHPEHLLTFVILPTLSYMGEKFNTPAAQQLLLATAAQESHCGHFLHQIGGPAVGIYQIEPATFDDLEENYLKYEPSIARKVNELARSPALTRKPGGEIHDKTSQLIGDLHYATAVARAQYYRFSEKLPEFDDFEAMWSYYKRYWNTDRGAATRGEFKNNWNAFVAPSLHNRDV